jgi:phospholipid/cholesterol/gamma-HCH transport system permease protein
MPRLVAGLIAVPALCLYVNAIGLIGGAIVAAANPHIAVSFHRFRVSVQQSVGFTDVLDSLLKALVFGVALTITACYVGLHATGGPEDIGRSVTHGVVLSFMFIFALNYLITRSLM